MYGEWSGSRNKKIKYYSCYNNHRVNPCNVPVVRVDLVDDMLIELLIKLINSSKFIDFLQSNLIIEVYNNRIKNLNINNLQEELTSLKKRKQFFVEQYENGIINETLYVKGDELFKERFNYLTNQLAYSKKSNYIIDTKTATEIKNDINVFVNKLSKLLKNSNVDIKYKSEIISKLVKSVEIDKKSVELKFMLQITQNLFVTILDKANESYENLHFTINFNL